MPRKNFRPIRVANKIIHALEPKRLEAERKEFRQLAMNAYCEKILWDFAEGRIGYLGKDAVDEMRQMLDGTLKTPEDPMPGLSVWDRTPPQSSRSKPEDRQKAKPPRKPKVSGE